MFSKSQGWPAAHPVPQPPRQTLHPTGPENLEFWPVLAAVRERRMTGLGPRLKPYAEKSPSRSTRSECCISEPPADEVSRHCGELRDADTGEKEDRRPGPGRYWSRREACCPAFRNMTDKWSFSDLIWTNKPASSIPRLELTQSTSDWYLFLAPGASVTAQASNPASTFNRRTG